MNRVDVLVVGGGPAGASAALTLARLGKTVLVIERSHYRDWRPGESLSPRATAALGELGVLDRFAALDPVASYGIRACWGDPRPYSIEFIFDAYGTGYQVDRPRFDAMLADACADAGATLLPGTCLVGLERRDGGWRATVSGAGRLRAVATRSLVDASGRNAVVARSVGARRRRYDRLIGVVAILDAAPASDVEATLLLEAVETGWWYSAPVAQSRIAVAYMTDTDLLGDAPLSARAFAERLVAAPSTAARVKSLRVRALHVRPAVTARIDRAAGDRWLAVGDAGEAYDPLSGIGLTKALTSGQRAGRALASALDGETDALPRFAAETAASFRLYLEQRGDYYTREQRWVDSPFWRRRSRLASPRGRRPGSVPAGGRRSPRG